MERRRLDRPICGRWAPSPPFSWPPLRPARLGLEPESVDVVLSTASPQQLNPSHRRRDEIDRHRHPPRLHGRSRSPREVRSAPRSAGGRWTPQTSRGLAASLDRSDQVALEVSGNAWEVVRILAPHVDGATRRLRAPPTPAMRQARAKTDRLDARALARLLASGQLETVWVPDEATQAMRRRLQRRSQLVHAHRSAAKERDPCGADERARPKARPGSATSSARRAGGGWPSSSCRRPSASRSQASCARSSSASPRDRRDREGGRFRGPGLFRGDWSTDGRARGGRDHRGGVHGGGRRHPPLPPDAQAGRLSRPRSAVRQSGSARPPTGGSQSRARPGLATPSSRAPVDGPPAGPVPGVLSARGGRRGHQLRSSPRHQARLPVLDPVDPREDYAYTQPSLTRRKLRRLEIRAGAPTLRASTQASGGRQKRCAMPSARWPNRPRPPTSAPSPTGANEGERKGERAPARHRGAHLAGRQAGKQRDRPRPGSAL